jgi:hypothetical protein
MFTALIVAGCDSTKSPVDVPDDGGPRIPSTTVVIDSAAARLVSDSASHAQGVIKLLISGSPPRIAVGNVIVGAQRGGFLRRVDSVRTAGDTIILATSQAVLTEAVERGEFKVTMPLRLGDAASVQTTTLPSGDPVTIHWQPTRLISAAPGISATSDGFSFNETELSRIPGLSLRVVEGNVTFTPAFTLQVNIANFAVKEATTSVAGNLSADARFILAANASVLGPPWDREMVSIAKDFVAYIGPVPVTGRVRLSFVAEAEVKAERGIATGGFTAATQVTAGGGWKDGNFSRTFAVSPSFTAHPLTWEEEFNAEARVGVKPVVKVTLYPQVSSLVEPVFLIEAGPYLKGKYEKFFDASGRWKRSATVDLDGKVAGELSILTRQTHSASLPWSTSNLPIWADSGRAVGRFSGSVVDGLTYRPIAGATIAFLKNGTAVASALSAPDGYYTSPEIGVDAYEVRATANGYVTVTMRGAAVARDRTTTLEPIPMAPNNASPGAISGAVRNARSYGAVTGATVELREGMNDREGTVVATTTTGTGGAYRLSGLRAGTYTLVARVAGYANGVKTGIVVGDREVSGQDIVLSPDGTASEIRIVLEWGASPSDLDSHLTGPTQDGGRFHIYYANRGNLNSTPYAALDRDDTDSYGPETITITRQLPGTYRYSVHNFSDRSASGSTRLASSGARVAVYRGNTLLHRFYAPNVPGNLWTVFDMNGERITPVNQVSDGNTVHPSANVGGVQSTLNRAVSDAPLVLPSKRSN